MQRVESLTVGFQNFRALMTPTGRITTLKKQTLIDPPTKEVLTVLFAPEGSFVQDLLLTEVNESLIVCFKPQNLDPPHFCFLMVISPSYTFPLLPWFFLVSGFCDIHL